MTYFLNFSITERKLCPPVKLAKTYRILSLMCNPKREATTNMNRTLNDKRDITLLWLMLLDSLNISFKLVFIIDIDFND